MIQGIDSTMDGIIEDAIRQYMEHAMSIAIETVRGGSVPSLLFHGGINPKVNGGKKLYGLGGGGGKMSEEEVRAWDAEVRRVCVMGMCMVGDMGEEGERSMREEVLHEAAS